MVYIAKHYVNLDGTVYTPGDVIDKPIDAEKERRLLALGAIRKRVAPIVEAEADDEDMADADTEHGESRQDSADAADDEGQDDSVDDAEDDSEDETEDEFEEVEPMEIDAAESITPAEESAPEAEEKPARKRGRRKE